jgi:hypothetical protein
MNRARLGLVLLVLAAALAGCSKRHVVPISLTGAGAGLMVGGFVYRATLPEEDAAGPFGRTPQHKAVTSVLIFGGAALVLTGVILAITTPICETDGDCWAGDRCDQGTSSCVQAPESAGLSLEPLASGRFDLCLAPAEP